MTRTYCTLVTKQGTALNDLRRVRPLCELELDPQSGEAHIVTMSKRCGFTPKGIIFALLVMEAIQLLWFYIMTDVVKKVHYSGADNKTFYVKRFQILNDFIQLSGQFYHHEHNASLQSSDTLLNIKGIERLLPNIKPGLSEVRRLDDTITPFENFLKVGRKVKDINCKKIFEGERNETTKAKTLLKMEPATREQISAKEYINITTDCQQFKNNRGYVLSHLTEEEREFPIAYSILMFKAVWQFERLLRAIYRPQNFYCIHIDIKSDHEIFTAVQKIAQCFDNVFILSKRIDVRWGNTSVLDPEIFCMQELWNKSKTWKYFINLTGQEFPLRTNYELVQILRAYNGSNDIEGTIKRANKWRWAKQGPPPHGITPVKGNVHVAVCRGFVDFALHDKRAHDLLAWARKTYHPDETFFATLNHNPSLNVPGSYTGIPETNHDTKPFVARFIKWGNRPCKGKRVRSVCIFGVEDLPSIAPRKELFTNKFYWNFQHFALDCMEELNFNNTRDEYLGKLAFDASWYSKLGFVLNKKD